jgi:hypothetical protein
MGKPAYSRQARLVMLEVVRNRPMDDEIIESYGGREQVLRRFISSSRGFLNPCRSIRSRETTGNIGRYSPEFELRFLMECDGFVEVRSEDLFELETIKHGTSPSDIAYHAI